MEIQILGINSKQIHTIELKHARENYSTCPQCSHNRKKHKDKCMSFNGTTKVGYCNHCEERYVEYKPYEIEIKYHKPIWHNFTELNEKAVKYLNSRMISQNTINKMKISSKHIYFQQEEKESSAICFPYYRENELVNIKYRNAKKHFKLESGAELIWYNYNALLEYEEIIICEGEMDLLSFVEEGFDNVISVPNGANTSNMPYFDKTIEILEKKKKIYIAVDNDTKGIELRNELVRRLGFDKCYICNFKQYKDANEYLCHYGRESLLEVIKTGKIHKIEDVYYADDIISDVKNLFNNGLQKGKSIGIEVLDEIITWETKRLAVFSGTPGSGKSEFVDFVNVKLNILYDWRVAYWTPENFPLQYHYSKLAEKLYGLKFDKHHISENTFWEIHNYIQNNFFWISPEDDLTIDNILEKASYFVKTKGIKVLCIDPFNKLEYKLERGDTKIDYISKILDKLIKFAKYNDVLVQLVAHPRKLEKNKDGTYPLPTMYDISGSSDFWNKCDYGIALQREQDTETRKFLNNGKVSIQKVKFKHLGQMGVWDFKYNYNNGRYENNDSTVDNWDNTSWINTNEKNIHQEKNIEIIKKDINILDYGKYNNDCPF